MEHRRIHPAGYYYVEVWDDEDHHVDLKINLTQPEPDMKPDITAVVHQYQNGYNVSAYGQFDGSIDLTVTGGAGIYAYRWEDGITTQDRTGLSGGNYGVVIYDTSHCGNNQKFFMSYNLKEPEKNIWTMDGNSSSNPPNQFIGTLDNNPLVFKTNNTERLRINANGNIGIGLTNPTEKLTVAGNGSISDNFSIGKKLVVTGSLKIDTLAGSGYKPDSLSTKSLKLVYVDQYGNLTAPSNPWASDNPPGYDFVCGKGNFPWKLGGNEITDNYTDFIGTCNYWAFRIKTDGFERMRISPMGNVGIGTTNPLTSLDLNGHLNIHDDYNAGVIYFPNPGNLYIRSDSDPLTYEATSEKLYIGGDGNVGIGTTSTNINNQEYKLAVKGKIVAQEVLVTITGWSDFVLDKNYNLLTLSELEKYINKHKHLPDVPSATEVAKNGVALGQTQALLLQKIEELTLYVIELNKQIELLKVQNNDLQKNISKIQNSK